jgi:hypothetical protein
MDKTNTNYLDPQLDFPKKRLERRRKLLPWWIIGFIWLFLVFSALMPVGIIMGLLKHNFEISLLGVSTDQPISLIGVFLISLFLFKGVTAFALWTEKVWAVGLAKIDAIISAVVCILAMVYAIFVLHTFSLRLELVVAAFYFYKMNQLQYDWENFESPESITEVIPETL